MRSGMRIAATKLIVDRASVAQRLLRVGSAFSPATTAAVDRSLFAARLCVG